MKINIPINRPSITDLEIEYVNDAIRNGWGTNCYDYIDKFESEFSKYIGCEFSMSTSSCTGAIHLALIAMGIKAGDEVIVPEISWIATVAPILYLGAKPIFVDVLIDTWCIDTKKIEEKITSKTKAIIVVHLYGNLCEMNDIMEIALKYNLFVLEDAAEALGSKYHTKKAGSIAHAGVFSFHGTKTMTTGEGGMIVTNINEINNKIRILNNHGRNPSDPENKMFWMRDYGYKYKMSNLQAALGFAQIKRLDELVQKKRVIFNWYSELLKSIRCSLNPEKEGTFNSYWLPTVIFEKSLNFNREYFFDSCKIHGIDSRPFFYPLSSLPMFERNDSNKVAYDIYARGINLPSYNELQYDDAKKVVEILQVTIQSNG